MADMNMFITQIQIIAFFIIEMTEMKYTGSF